MVAVRVNGPNVLMRCAATFESQAVYYEYDRKHQLTKATQRDDEDTDIYAYEGGMISATIEPVAMERDWVTKHCIAVNPWHDWTWDDLPY